MPGFAIDTGSDYSSGGEVGATTPDVEEEYDDGGSSGGGSVDVGGGTVVPESGVTPEENTGTIDEGGTEDVVEDMYPDTGGVPESGSGIPDSGSFPAVDDGLSTGFWDLVIDSEGNIIEEESGTSGDILDALDGDRAGVDDRALHTGDFDLGQYEPDWDGDGESGGNLSDRDFDGDGNPGGNLIPDINIPEFNVPDPEINLDLSGITTSVIAGVVVLGLGYMFTSQGAGS